MRTTNSLGNRLVAFILSFIMVLGMLPTGATAVSSSVMTTTLGDTDYVVGQTTEFTVTTTGNEDAGTMVLGSFEIQKNGNAVNIADVAKLEYREASTGNWYEFYGDFGPATTGFPLQEAATTSNFRVTFKESGEYTVKVFVKTFADGTELCAVEKTVSVVKANPAMMTTTLGEQNYTVGQIAEFTVTTTGNEDAGTMVLGSFEIQKNGSAVNIADVAKLEYREASTGTWYEFYGDFGPAATGFPLQEAATTSNFRVTFKVHGEYTVKVFVKTFADSAELCAVEKTVSVVKANPATMTTTLADQSYTVGQTTEFTVTTTGNEDAGTMVLGSFEIKKNGSVVNIADVAKLEYREASTGTWYEFYGDFGPAATGFPLQEAATTSNFRVTFKEGGEYTVKVFVKTFADSEELCSVEKTIVAKTDQVDFAFADEEPVISFNDNADNKYTFEVQNAKGTVTYTIESGSDIAEINATTGELTVSKPGQITVKASDSGNALYNPADATYTLTVNKDDQEITFATPVLEDQWIGQAYTNTASGGNGTGTISYWLVSGEELVEEINGVAKINKETGAVTFLCAGTQVTVKAVKAADDCYAEATATYSVTAIKQEPVDFGFTTSGPITITYDPTDLVFNNAVVGNDADDVVTWSVVSGADVADLDTATGILTIKKAGTIVIKATIKESPYYLEKSVEYTLTVNPANQTALDTSNVSTTITYSPNVQEGLIVAAGGSGTGAYGYEIVEGNEFATIDEATGAIKILKAGIFVGDEFVNGVIKVKITKAGDDCYNAAEPAYVTITLARAEQTGFGFGETEKVTVTYNDNNNQYELEATGGQSVEDVVYTFSGDAVEVNEATGVVTILKSGVVTILATKPADDKYNAATDSYELTIEKDEQEYTLTETGTVSLKYGTLSYTNAVIQGTNVSKENKPNYTISQNDIGASINSTTGKVTFVDSEGKIGKATVTVTVAEDDCYKKFTASYEIDISYLAAPDSTCTLSGTKATPDSTSDWFVKDLKIEAPEGYEISFDNELISTTDWDEAQPYAEPGETTAKVYLKRISDGAITDAINVSVKYDDTAPEDLKIDYKSSFTQLVLQKIFMLTNGNMTVEFSAKDADSGIAMVEYSLDEGETFTTLEAKNGVYSVVIKAEMKNHVALRVTNGAGTVAEMLVDEKVLVIDKTSPVIDAAFSGEYTSENGILYTKDDDFAITFRVDDANFSDIMNQEKDGTKKSLPVVTVNGTVVEDLNWSDVSGHGEAVLPLPDEGDYKIVVTASDRLNNADSYEVVVHVDKTAPSIKPVVFTSGEVKNTTADGRDYYNAFQTATIVIEEHSFNAEGVQITITANGKEVPAADYIKTDWNSDADKHTLVLEFAEDANYTLDLAYTDIPGNAAEDYTTDLFTVDTTKPDDKAMSIEYKTLWWSDFLNNVFGFAQDSVEVTISASDVTAGIKSLSYSCNGTDFTTIEGDSYTFTIPAQYEGQIVLRATDYSDWTTEYKDGKTVIVDNICPEVQISYDTTNRKDQIEADNGTIASDRQTMETSTEQTRFVYNGNITATLRVDETHFYSNQVKIIVTRDGVELAEKTEITTEGYCGSAWTETEQDGKKYQVKTLTLSGDGDYVITVEYSDESHNGMNWSTDEHTGKDKTKYVSNIHTIDTKAPEVTVTYTDKDTNVANTNYHSDDRAATITIKDRNFRPNEVVLTVTAKNVAGTDIAVYDYEALKLTSWLNNNNAVWTLVAENTWKTNVDIPFSIDGNYTVEVAYKDIAENDATITPYEKTFTVDHNEPKDLSISYSTNVFEEIISAISLGYYDAPATVTLKATDLVAGIEYFTITAKANGPETATTVELPNNLVVDVNGKFVDGTAGFLKEENVDITSVNGTVTMVFKVPAQFRGLFEFGATDMGHLTEGENHPQVQVVDTIDPQRTVTFEPTAIVDKATLADVETMAEGDNVILYYNKDAVASIEIIEANFYPEDVVVKVNNTKVNLDSEWTTPEGRTDDVWTNTLTLKGDGDYVITIEYKDRSTNEMKAYTSQTIVIDTTAPVIDVKYSNTDVKNTIEGRDYFSAAQTATITIQEHNFRADDVVINVTAKDVLGADVLTLNTDGTVKAYADQGADRKSWTSYEAGTWRVEDDAFVITLNYTTDANYTFDIEYQDLAKNKAADYEQDLFTVDATAPENLTVAYSTSVFEQIKESITFGYYNAQMTVTITAEDDTSGIYHFAYSYINSEGVSSVNKELLDQAIKEAEITYDGKKATATFTVPKMVLGSDNQFNGTVEFTAYDRSEVSTELEDTTRIIVDNISPTATITYNAPVQTANGISYYDGNIEATIVINEANFDAADVNVTVTKDGANYPVNVAWRDNSVDTHTGTFTLTADGDYIVSVQYKDKSGNQMTSYTSNELTLDTTKPTIKVSNIKANSANKDAEYSFAIEINDINLDASSLKPVLKAVKQTADGVYEVVEIDLGNAKTVVSGQTYTYTVENLPDDGLYTLTCEVKDMSANGMSQIVLEDGEAYDQVQFSINRNGSAFGYGDTFTEELVGQYYIYSVDNDVVIVEVNVDPIEDYKVTLNGEELTEGTDYTTVQTSKDGEWSKRTYTIKKDLFEAEGEYSIIVSSTDKADTTAFSDVKNLSLAFVVDQTKPVLTITGLEAGGRYQTEAQTVTLIPTDEGGRLNSLSVVVLDSDGNPLKDKETNEDISVRFEMSGEELLKYLEENDGKVTFTIPEGLNNQVKVICNDCAVNADDLTNEYSELFERVTVSQNQFVIFYANTPLFIGTIVGVLLVIFLIIFLIKRKKDKKNKEKVAVKN